MKKCSFGVSEITYLGHIVNEQGFSFSEERKAALLHMKTPSTVTELRTFLGLANYMRNHVSDFAALASPFHALTKNTSKKKTPITWTPELQEQFTRLKEAVYEAPMLNHLAEEGNIILYCDASDIACGAHLVQEINGVEKSVYFVSKTFSEVQRRWSVGDREMFAQYYGITQLRSFLGGRRFTLKTDHANLQYWYSETASSKVQRWRYALSEYDFAVEHIQGEFNYVADALSRLVNITVTGDKAAIIANFHNGIEGHSGIKVTVQRMKNANHNWTEFRAELSCVPTFK
jgi:hypothetical protein